MKAYYIQLKTNPVFDNFDELKLGFYCDNSREKNINIYKDNPIKCPWIISNLKIGEDKNSKYTHANEWKEVRSRERDFQHTVFRHSIQCRIFYLFNPWCTTISQYIANKQRSAYAFNILVKIQNNFLLCLSWALWAMSSEDWSKNLHQM